MVKITETRYCKEYLLTYATKTQFIRRIITAFKTSINERQRKVLNMLFDNFEGKLQSSKWAKINKVSSDTALRDIKDLIEKGILRQTNQGGRSVNYELVDF